MPLASSVGRDRPSLLFLTTDVPYPADSGGRLKTFRLLEHLSKSFDVKLLCAYGGGRQQDLAKLKARLSLSGLQAFQNHLPRTGWHFFQALMGASTFNAYRIYSSEFESMLEWSTNTSDVVLVDHIEMIDMLPQRKLGAKVVYHSHNAEFVLWQEYARINGNFLTQWIYEWEASRIRNLEGYAIRKCDMTFAAPNDIEHLKELPNIDESRFAPTYHLGNDTLLGLPAIDLSKNSKQLFYAGTLSWEPNRDGLQWFLQRCWPHIRSKEPEATLAVCGRGAAPELLSIMKHFAGVTYHGFVEDLEPLMAASRCAIVPLRMGSGMKIKTFDALYRGLPLVTTTIGAEGIEIENKTHARIVDDPNAFSEAVIQTLNETATSTTMRDSARELCQREYRYSALLSQMEAAIRELL